MRSLFVLCIGCKSQKDEYVSQHFFHLTKIELNDTKTVDFERDCHFILNHFVF